MTLIEQWQQQLPESLAAFVKRAAEIKDIDLVSGVLPVAVLWPIRQQVKDYDGDASDAVHQIVGEGAGRILKIVSSWPDDRAMNDQLKQITAAAGGNGGGFDIQVLSPAETGQISGATREERAQSAQKLADQINADPIVYGNLRSGATASSFVPEFYLSDRQLQDAKELPGQYEFGSSIETSANITTNPAASPRASSGNSNLRSSRRSRGAISITARKVWSFRPTIATRSPSRIRKEGLSDPGFFGKM